MSQRAPTAASLTRDAVTRIQEGDIAAGRSTLAEALAVNPDYEAAWLWFAHVAANAEERRFCLEQAARANPDSDARQALAKLRHIAAAEPPEVIGLVAPPPPTLVEPNRFALLGLSLRSRQGMRGLGIALLVLAVVFGVALPAVIHRRQTPLYVAVVGNTGGTDPGVAGEVIRSAKLYFDRVNAAGGVAGHPVELLIFDDKNDVGLARSIAEQIVADGRALLVIGHRTSPDSEAAGAIYAAAGIPAITSTSTADNITADNQWYFRTVFDNRTQGYLIAAYASEVLGADHLSVVAGNAGYGRYPSKRA